MRRLLALDPVKRITATNAMDHAYFKEEPAREVPDMRDMGEWHEMDAKMSRRKKGSR